MDHRPQSPAYNPHAEALHACIAEALAEAPGLASRWVTGLSDLLKQQEGWTANSREKISLGNAIKVLIQHRQQFESDWAAHWSHAITDALQRRGEGVQVRRSLANINFDQLELMDDSQIQATVQVAKIEQAVQGAAGDALTELSALLSRAQGFPSVKIDHNPLRPDVAVAALRRTMDGITNDKGARTLWLQQGTPILGQELQVLYRHLIRLLETHGVTPAGFNVVQAPNSAGGAKAGSAYVRQRPVGVADGREAESELAPAVFSSAAASKVARPPADFLTLNHLHQLLVAEPPNAGIAELLPGASGAPTPIAPSKPQLDPWNVHPVKLGANVANIVSLKPGEFPALPSDLIPAQDVPQRNAASGQSGVNANPNLGVESTYGGRDRRSRRESDSGKREEVSHQLKALASEVVQLMLDGMMRDTRLLPPVRQMLQQLEPALMRIAHEDPRFFADKLNPARRLLDEVTQRSLAFENVGSRGLSRFLGTLNDVAELFLRVDVDVSTLFETALEVLAPEQQPADMSAEKKAHGRAVATLVKAEQRHLLAEKVAHEIAQRPDFRKADAQVQAFVQGPWAQVIAQARLEPATYVQPGSLSSDLRYLGVLSDLLWSSRPEVSQRNRGRLARLIPGLLRTLREGLHTIDYETVASRKFFNAIMALHESGLKGEVEKGRADSMPLLVLPAEPPPPVAPVVKPQDGLWMRPDEAADTGFMTDPFPELQHDDFVDTQPVLDDIPLESFSPEEVPAFAAGAWLSLQNESGQWQRVQLTWSSPHGTMYLFTGSGGQTTSMTRRSFEKLWHSQRITLVAAHSVVDDALDSVLDVAFLNSAREPAPPQIPDTNHPDLLPPLG